MTKNRLFPAFPDVLEFVNITFSKSLAILKTRLMISLQLGQCAAMMSVDTRGKSQTNRPERLHSGWLQLQLRMLIFVANGTVGNGYDLLSDHRFS